MMYLLMQILINKNNNFYLKNVNTLNTIKYIKNNLK